MTTERRALRRRQGAKTAITYDNKKAFRVRLDFESEDSHTMITKEKHNGQEDQRPICHEGPPYYIPFLDLAPQGRRVTITQESLLLAVKMHARQQRTSSHAPFRETLVEEH